VKVERSTFCVSDEYTWLIGKNVSIVEWRELDKGFIVNDEYGEQYFFNLSDLSPVVPPQTIEQFGRTYRLVEGWREIETAPRDGTWFLTYTPNYYGVRVSQAHISAHHDDWLSHIDTRNGGSWKGGVRPTHWMPLPAPPAMKEPTP